MSGHLVRDRQTALYAGVGLWVAGAILIWDAYRGRETPWPLKLLGPS